jgi:hypothetical protein
LNSHPVDNFFVNMLPFGLSVKLFRMHGARAALTPAHSHSPRALR